MNCWKAKSATTDMPISKQALRAISWKLQRPGRTGRKMKTVYEVPRARSNCRDAVEDMVRHSGETRRSEIKNSVKLLRFAFPLVRAVFPNLVAQDLVSVQPMDGPVGLIFYFDLIYGNTKGSITAGQPVFSSLTGHGPEDFYGSPEVRDEAVGTGDGVTVAFGPTLAWIPVVRGTVRFTDGTQEITDDGNGRLIGDVAPAVNCTINYLTGVCAFSFAVAPALNAAITVDYEYDNEANQQLPEIAFQLTSSPVVARIFKLTTSYSLEAAQNLRSLHGLSAETELVAGLGQEIRFEIDRSLIKDVNSFAAAQAVSWMQTPAAGISWTEHKLSLIDVMIQASNNIFALTRRGMPNWIVMGLSVSNVVESLPGFKPSAEMMTPAGVINAGVLNGRWKVFKDYSLN